MRDRSRSIDDAALRQMELEMQDDLHNLRQSATVYAERAWAHSANLTATRQVTRSPWVTWGLGAATAAVLVVGGVRLVQQASPSGTSGSQEAAAAASQAGSPAVTDEALLDQIAGDLSSGVPAAMQPLEASDVRGSSASGASHNE